jgi:hypothetical protein
MIGNLSDGAERVAVIEVGAGAGVDANGSLGRWRNVDFRFLVAELKFVLRLGLELNGLGSGLAKNSVLALGNREAPPNAALGF